jgi:hypothetical protein
MLTITPTSGLTKANAVMRQICAVPLTTFLTFAEILPDISS